ncbi:unnamed protein product [Closterium sp. Naga37s-1]|nr:unnamed protein product [Closterium sp. Naga37s-1]
MEVLNEAERSAIGAADAVKELLDALRGHLKEVTSNTVAHVEVERDAASRLQGAGGGHAWGGHAWVSMHGVGMHGVSMHGVGMHGVGIHGLGMLGGLHPP